MIKINMICYYSKFKTIGELFVSNHNEICICQSLFFLGVFIFVPFFFFLSLIGLLQAEPYCKLLQLLLSWLSLPLTLGSLICRRIVLGRLGHTLLKAHSYRFGKLWVINFHPSHISSTSPAHENVSAKQLLTQINFSWLNKDTVAVVLLRNCCDKCLYLISLLLTAVSKTNYVNCDSIFFQLFGKDFQGVDILGDCGGYETHYSLFLGVVSPVLEGKAADLQCLCQRKNTWVKCSSPWTLTPNRQELTLVESLVMVHRTYTCLPPMRPRPTEDCMFDYNLA